MNVFHGDIVTCDDANHVFSYLAEENGRIVHVGDDLPDRYASWPTIELGGRALMPAFGDGHIHFSNFALLSRLDIRSADCIADQVDMLAEHIRDHPREKIYLAFGASRHNVKEKRLVTRQELDSAGGGKPVVVVCYDGHSAICNSLMIDMFPPKIKKLRGFDAHKGHLFHEAFLEGVDFASKKVPLGRVIKASLEGVDKLAEKGIGMAHVVEGVGFPRDMDVDLIRFLARSSQIDFKVFFQTMDVRKVVKRKMPRIGGCFACALDGCYGALDAALIKPYASDPDNRGILFYSDEAVADFTKAANRKELQIEMHAIGDEAFRQAVDALEAALIDYPRTDHRHTIIHAFLPTQEGLETCAKYQIGITTQPSLIHFPLEPLSYIEEILGKERAAANLPLRNLLDMGIHVSGGSDGPVTYPDPIEGIYAACNHANPSHSVTVSEALRMFTYEVARTGFDEKNRGTLEKGKIADLVVLNDNPLTMNSADLGILEVESVLYAGQPYTPGKGVFKMLVDGLMGSKKRNGV